MNGTSIDSTYDGATWGSHLPALMACVAASNSKLPVLEIGVGFFSTFALHMVCGVTDRRLISIESSLDWMNRFLCLEAAWHQFHSSLDDVLAFRRFDRFSVALVDDSPGGDNRRESFIKLLPICDYVLVHDYHNENEAAIGPWLSGVKFHAISCPHAPPTLVASQRFSIPARIL